MKRLIPTIAFVFLSIFISFGQTPDAINYQAIARDSTGAILTDQAISVRITIMKDSTGGTAVYQETHGVNVNAYGLVNLAIGTGTVISGNFQLIEWYNSEHYLKVEIDPDAGNNYSDFGTTQLISVPYALESRHSSSLTLTDEEGNRYNIKVDTSGNIIAEEINPEVPCGEVVLDTRDGQSYNTVKIGTQCWMAKDMNIGTRIDGLNAQSNNGVIEKYCYNDSEDSCEIYGGLYQWNEAMQYTTDEGTQGICPAGWHISTRAEWDTLVSYLGGSADAGGKMKEAGTEHWVPPNYGATNESGFTGLPSGIRGNIGNFSSIGYYAVFWTSTQESGSDSWYFFLRTGFADVNYGHDYIEIGYSVRCVKDI
jgi:uncharacterized protein (TIGR02145 family)